MTTRTFLTILNFLGGRYSAKPTH